MITGIGMDMIETERVAAKIAKETGFRELVFSAAEIDYCETKKNKYEHYAARFAAKEAFFKALGTGWMNGTAFNEVEVVNTESGKPELMLTGETLITIGKMPVAKIYVSLSHLKDIATAVVIIES